MPDDKRADADSLAPSVTVAASISGGDERHGLDILVNGINQPQDDHFNVKVEGVPYDAEVAIRPHLYQRASDPVETPDQRRERLGTDRGYVRGDDPVTGEMRGTKAGEAEKGAAKPDAAKKETSK